MRRIKDRVTNVMLANSIANLEARQDSQDAEIHKLQMEMGPIQDSLRRVEGGVNVVKWAVSGVSVATAALELYKAISGK